MYHYYLVTTLFSVSKRNWSAYNESLIERSHILMDIGFLKQQRSHYEQKESWRPILYPNSFLEFLSFLKVGFSISYRIVQKIVRG